MLPLEVRSDLFGCIVVSVIFSDIKVLNHRFYGLRADNGHIHGFSDCSFIDRVVLEMVFFL